MTDPKPAPKSTPKSAPKPIRTTCPECLSPTNPGARRCAQCGVILVTWQRRLLHASALVAAVAVFVPLWQIAGALGADKDQPFAVSVSPVSCSEAGVVLELFNAEPEDALRLASLRLVALDAGGMDAVWRPDPAQSFQYLAAQGLGKIRFVPDPVQAQGMALVCGMGCMARFEVTMTGIRGGRETRDTVRCALSPA